MLLSAQRKKRRDLHLRKEHKYWVYIMASRSKTLYVGITDDMYRRALEHKSGTIEGFTKRYHIISKCLST